MPADLVSRFQFSFTHVSNEKEICILNIKYELNMSQRCTCNTLKKSYIYIKYIKNICKNNILKEMIKFLSRIKLYKVYC